MWRRTLQRCSPLTQVTAAHVSNKLKASPLLKPTAVNVTDISGGCGSFFKVEVTSPAFAGKSLLAQHRLINDELKEEIKILHGLTIVTRTP